MYPFLVTFREGLEAALIVGVVLACLARLGARRERRWVWAGAAAAVGLSGAAGALLAATAARLEGEALEVFEGAAMLAAAGVLTYVIVWMKRQSRQFQTRLRGEVERAVRSGSRLALAGLSFALVAREGLETVLFLQAGAAAGTGAGFGAAAAAGLAAAAVAGALAYTGAVRLPLRLFFGITGAVLVLFAAGMVANGVHALEELGLVPSLLEPVWSTEGLIPSRSAVGQLLAALLGYDATPSLARAAAFFGYLALGLGLFLRPTAPRRA